MSTTVSAVDLEKGIRATLVNRMATEPNPLIDQLCARISSQSETEKHEYFGDSPQMDEFKGTRRVSPLLDKSVTITNKIYDAAVRFKRDDLRRSKGGQLNLQRQSTKLINTVLSFPKKRLMDLVVAGTGTTEMAAYDGVSFFNNSHPALDQEGGTQDNLLAGSGTTTAQLSADIVSTITAFYGYKGTNGEPFFSDQELKLMFVFGPSMNKAFREVLNSQIISNTSNVQVGIGQPHMTSRLSDANDWYAFVTNPGYEPLIWQDEQSLETDLTAEGSELWTKHRQAEIGVSMGLGAGYGYWQSAIKVVNS